MYPPGGVHHKIRTVLAEFGVKNTYETLMEIMKSDYEVLGTFFTQTGSTVPTPTSTPTAPTVEKKEKKPVKKANKEEAVEVQNQNQDTIDSLVTSKFTPGTKILVTKEKEAQGQAITATKVEALPPATLPKFSSSTEAKQWQREQEEARKLNNEQRGINSESILTVDSMREWIEVNKYTYAQIARDIVGLPEYRIAEFAKQNGILSETAKRRAAIIARVKR
jgi:hypothetical protein